MLVQPEVVVHAPSSLQLTNVASRDSGRSDSAIYNRTATVGWDYVMVQTFFTNNRELNYIHYCIGTQAKNHNSVTCHNQANYTCGNICDNRKKLCHCPTAQNGSRFVSGLVYRDSAPFS